ncbi:uncharacterized protein LOC128963114 [Oppia nitens]|uniref:uncharacterized protein LOC128963114 n=1 Tax=Oppia nitens TaxID=1686743 RepID=UPI0023D9EB41|nr:uncharacterized protein LOC128963114 [Oppia nitens]
MTANTVNEVDLITEINSVNTEQINKVDNQCILESHMDIDIGVQKNLLKRKADDNINQLNSEFINQDNNDVITVNTNNHQQLTMLLLGETGVGKSTFINAFVNYLLFDKMVDAVNKLHCLIPTKFTLTDPETDLDMVCTFGEPSDTENTDKTCKSATQYPRCYTFDFGDYRLNIIDTPGIADTGGLTKDKQNIQNILNFISNYKTINGICVLLKPNQSRGTAQFLYTLNELLSQLNKSAADNIMFVFTNARSTFYAPGDTTVPIKTALNKIKQRPPNVEIKFDKTNRFCFDNESFRYLVAVSQPNNINFDEDIQSLYGNSWEKSVKECLRMMSYISDVKPHNVKETLSVNEAKRTIKLLTQPLADITENIADNIKTCEIRKENIKQFNGNIEDLKRELYIPVIEIESKPLDYPMTVCEDKDCVEIVVIDGQSFKHYRQLCHEHCYLDIDDGNVIGNVGILGCVAFGNRDNNCRYCRHSYMTHLHVRYETRKVNSERRDEFKSNIITDKQKAMEAQQEMVKELADRQIEFENESKVINECMAEFAAFLKHNALTPFNDAFEDYVKHLIRVEEHNLALIPGESSSRQSVEQLESLLKQYQHEKNVIIDSMEKNGDNYSAVTLDDIDKCLNKLYSLPINGQKIQQMIKMQLNIVDKIHVQTQQQVIEVPVNQNNSIVKGLKKFYNNVSNNSRKACKKIQHILT